MAEVDPDDDTVDRYVLQHYRHDPDRHERRQVTVAACDDEAEFGRRFDVELRALTARQADGSAEPWEQISGVFREAGYHARSSAARTALRATRRVPRA